MLAEVSLKQYGTFLQEFAALNNVRDIRGTSEMQHPLRAFRAREHAVSLPSELQTEAF